MSVDFYWLHYWVLKILTTKLGTGFDGSGVDMDSCIALITWFRIRSSLIGSAGHTKADLRLGRLTVDVDRSKFIIHTEDN